MCQLRRPCSMFVAPPFPRIILRFRGSWVERSAPQSPVNESKGSYAWEATERQVRQDKVPAGSKSCFRVARGCAPRQIPPVPFSWGRWPVKREGSPFSSFCTEKSVDQMRFKHCLPWSTR